MSFPGSTPPRLRVVAIGDADSFVKWAAHLVDQVDDISQHLLLVQTPLVVSDAQRDAALAGTRFARHPRSVTRIRFSEVTSWLAKDAPDVVVLAGRAPFVRLMGREIDRLRRRPVVVSGLPGMSIPALRGALEYRRHCDLMVVHSHREVDAFERLGRALGVNVPIALATLPFAGRRHARSGGTDLVFAAQALVPAQREDRRRIAEILRLAAVADPTRRVVVKLRSRPGEVEAHQERDGYTDLLDNAPENLIFSFAPMREALDTAEGLVTVSSTAAIEAMAAGVPVIALDEFGVQPAMLNHVFTGSGLLGGADDVVARRFRHPDPAWAATNYFHDPRDSGWWAQVRMLVAQRRRGDLPARVVPAERGGALHAAWHRRQVLGAEDTTFSGWAASIAVTPLLAALARVRHRRAGGADAVMDDVTLAPSPLVEPIRRRTAASPRIR
ncbi:hypothetical protein JF550_01615 [Microbacterium esteraromaticum]|uniref:Uncharacterized protein n=1 Tax=Microbacterium esteraromaticum TaxID=57043 RepID=A0A939IQG1_9MICO|nr:DUF6716 putative glycosyltransferase [Microbacterium esteraromaticum]MBN8204650.1 hypothetical protein [Microbacterium esteraromaticum]MBN8414804.1 hypothetical protein [Microbacterium esteraromaticum]